MTLQLCAMESMRHSSLAARAERRAVVEEGAAIPGAVPAVRLDGRGVGVGLQPELAGDLRVAARVRVLGEGPQGGDQEPRQPDALAAALRRRPGSCRRSSRRRRSAAGRARPRCRPAAAPGGNARRRCRAPRRPAGGRTPRARRARAARIAQERAPHSSSTDASPVDAEVVVHDVGQPGEIVREAGPDAASALRVPPVLHVALDELPAGGAQDVLARERRLGVDERHHVLQLIAEAVRAAALVERRPGPDAAGERLVQRPAIEHRVEAGLRRAHGDTESRSLPGGDGRGRVPRGRARRRRTSASAAAPRPHPRRRRAGRRSRASRPAPARRRTAARRTGSMPAPVAPERVARGAAPSGAAAEPLRPRNSRRLRGVAGHRLADAHGRPPAGELGVEAVLREDRAVAAVERVRTWCCVCSRMTPSVHSTYVVRMAARRRARVRHPQQRELHRRVVRDAER